MDACQTCNGTGLDKAHTWPDGSFASCEICEGYGTKQEFNFTEKEKLAASIVDQLCPVIIHETGQHIGPKLFKKLTLRLTELL